MKNISHNPVIEPNSALNNKTGAWRTLKPETDYNVCIGCSLCAKLCPDGCINMTEQAEGQHKGKKKPVTDYDYCKGCGLCAAECPVKAIKMREDY